MKQNDRFKVKSRNGRKTKNKFKTEIKRKTDGLKLQRRSKEIDKGKKRKKTEI